jgi:hypothetical protein
MASAADLSLLNAAAAAVLYKPVKIETGAQARYVDRTQGVIALQPKVEFFFNEDSSKRKLNFKHSYPVLHTDGTIAFELAKFEFVSPLINATADRQESLARFRKAVDDAIVTAFVENGESPW